MRSHHRHRCPCQVPPCQMRNPFRSKTQMLWLLMHRHLRCFSRETIASATTCPTMRLTMKACISERKSGSSTDGL